MVAPRRQGSDAGSLFPCAHPAAATLCLAMPQACVGIAADGPPAGDDPAGPVRYILALSRTFLCRSMACLFGTRYPPQTLHSRLAGLEGRLACWGASRAPYSFIVRLAKLHASTLHLLVQAQEGDDKLGRQLRGADGATLHLVESARAQVDRIQRFQSSASWHKNVAIVFACVNLRFKCFVATSLLPSHLPPPHPAAARALKDPKGHGS